MTITNLVQKITLEIDNLICQINSAIAELEENKKMAVSEIFETDHAQDTINIASYRDNDTKLKMKIKILREALEEQKQLAIKIISETK